MILSLDIGTSSTRAVLYDTDSCRAVPGGTHSVHHEPDVTPDGGSTLDPEVLLREVIDCARAVLARAGNTPVEGVAVSTFWHSIIALNANGAAQTPVLLWSDTRSAEQVAHVKAEIDGAAYSQRTGCPLHTSYAFAKLRWLAETDPKTFAACVKFVSPGEYFFGRLFGAAKVTCSTSMASGTGFWDQTTQEWDRESLSRIDPTMTAERLSKVSDEPVSGLIDEFRERLPQIADVPWFPALGDGACSNIGCGAVAPGTLALMIGTSGALRVVVQGETPPPLPAGLWRYQIDRTRFLLGGALSNGGSVWAWAKRTLCLTDDDDALETTLATLKPDEHGLTILPFFSGERAPLWRDDLRATIHGLTTATTPEEIVRAHLEAVALRFAAVREALLTVAPAGTIIGTGGALISSPVWAQILSDALREPIAVSAEEQASSRGAMLWAREQLGEGRLEAAPPVPITHTMQPDTETGSIYQRAGKRQEALLQRLLPTE